MPTACNLRCVLLVWLLRACARRAWVYCSSSATRSSDRAPTRPESHKLLTTTAIAVRTWHTVNSGFSPPKVLVDLCQEQMTDRRDDQVPFQSLVQPAFVVIQTEFAFFIFKTAFDAPARKGHQ